MVIIAGCVIHACNPSTWEGSGNRPWDSISNSIYRRRRKKKRRRRRMKRMRRGRKEKSRNGHYNGYYYWMYDIRFFITNLMLLHHLTVSSPCVSLLTHRISPNSVSLLQHIKAKDFSRRGTGSRPRKNQHGTWLCSSLILWLTIDSFTLSELLPHLDNNCKAFYLLTPPFFFYYQGTLLSV